LAYAVAHWHNFNNGTAAGFKHRRFSLHGFAQVAEGKGDIAFTFYQCTAAVIALVVGLSEKP
jgi:hypothetical protein